MELTKVEQDYVKAIYGAQSGDKTKLISLKLLVSLLDVAAPTVTEAVKRLEKKQLVEYQSYKGVRLTDVGWYEARFILKAHRIWELFLLTELGYQEAEVHDEAEVLEHAASRKLIERLYDFLGNPKKCPHGNEIPREIFWYEKKVTKEVSELAISERAGIVSISDETVKYLTALGIPEKATEIKVLEKLGDGTFISEINIDKVVAISPYFQKDFLVEVYRR